MESVFFFYCLPLAVLVIAIIFTVPSIFISYARPILMVRANFNANLNFNARPCEFQVCFILNPMPQSLIFLIKNNHYREVEQVSKFYPCFFQVIRKQFMHRFTWCIPRSNAQISNSTAREGFTHLPSTSITRSIVAPI